MLRLLPLLIGEIRGCLLYTSTCQNLRPEAFVRNNLLTRFIELFYSFDTNTNAVSYTHLDVYKRQAGISAGLPARFPRQRYNSRPRP